MAKTPIGYEITDFLTGLDSIGGPNPQYASFVRKYTRFRKKEIKREERGLYSAYRVRMAESIAGLLLVLGWAAFFGCIFYLMAWPVIQNHGMDWEVIFQHIRKTHSAIFTSLAVAFFVFPAYFKKVNFRAGTVILSAIWSTFVIFSNVYGMGPYMDINSPAWIVFGNLLLAFTLVIVFCVRLGNYLHERFMERGDYLKDTKHVFTPFEGIFLVFMILMNGIGLYFLVDTNRFYALTEHFPLSRIVLSAIPVVIFILYCIWHANRMDGEGIDAWFSTSMEVFTTALILQIYAIPNLLRGLMLWLGLILISIVVLIYLGNIIGSPMAYLAIGMICLNFIVSASINYYSEETGTEILGAATHWWMVVPALFTASAAIYVTIKEMIRDKI